MWGSRLIFYVGDFPPVGYGILFIFSCLLALHCRHGLFILYLFCLSLSFTLLIKMMWDSTYTAPWSDHHYYEHRDRKSV
jgi:hypothetical protein